MDENRKKKLLLKYKYRKPEMGIIYFKCISTGDIFIGISKDTKADINSSSFKLGCNLHSNHKLQKMWNDNGMDDFEIGVLEVLPYDEKDKDKDDYTKELESLYERKLRSLPNARRIK
ncbi:hypothetical protein J2Z76_000629 [Sedimentibacter acidaminivorans]|uniref:GIY-YIG domain-containing protein n=1 Tax=Sedimentibacter acidaminivorans TaxID=913099 RepID=A0ABS4GAR2_9FIRM|nr:GIY-YIG nuclease family protein [Sedimentibacter acidaminivorans]MBP1924776.1 hypothetical protein [Sedimentibacter acidaminivorans]